ncbi:hypothetical protein [Candidatus Solirubrobacter pratensis]|uniref:hypothetical protein n=1 Tax=Candidatus Solirubrobacter pratensis TaxID=1298857 RepID=UPI0004158347|nr:hypothetical protein [Candidatus Solirubrobacter pratensis]
MSSAAPASPFPYVVTLAGAAAMAYARFGTPDAAEVALVSLGAVAAFILAAVVAPDGPVDSPIAQVAGVAAGLATGWWLTHATGPGVLPWLLLGVLASAAHFAAQEAPAGVARLAKAVAHVARLRIARRAMRRT